MCLIYRLLSNVSWEYFAITFCWAMSNCKDHIKHCINNCRRKCSDNLWALIFNSINHVDSCLEDLFGISIRQKKKNVLRRHCNWTSKEFFVFYMNSILQYRWVQIESSTFLENQREGCKCYFTIIQVPARRPNIIKISC